MLDLGSTGQEFDTHRRQGVVYLSKTLYPLLSSTGSTQEDRKASRYGWDENFSINTNKQTCLKFTSAYAYSS